MARLRLLAEQRGVSADICDWAEAHILVTTGGRTGPLELDPYQRAPLAAIADPDVRVVVLMWPSQEGKSMVICIPAGWSIAERPCDILMVHPSQAVRDRFNREKLSPMLLAMRGVRERVRTNNRGLLPVGGFATDGGSVTITTSSSVGGVTGATSRLVLADEVDLYPTGAWVVQSLRQRMRTMPDATLVIASTPTAKGDSVVESEFAMTDMREWEVPCPECGVYQALEVMAQATPEGIVCLHCAAVWGETARAAAVRRGRWVATNPDAEPGHVGFHMTQLASLNTPLARTLADARAQGPRHIATQVLARPYEDVEVETPPVEAILRCDRPFAPEYISIGVDVQRRTLEAVVISMPAHMEAIHVEASVSVRRTDNYECWHQLRERFQAILRGLPDTPLPVPVSVDGRGADGGGSWYAWVHEGLLAAYGGEAMAGDPPEVSVVMGSSGGRQLGSPQLWGARRGSGGYKYTAVSQDRAKADIYDAIRSGHFSVDAGIVDAVIDEILSERLVVHEGREGRSGRAGRITYTWVPVAAGRDNHALDAIVYAWCRASVMPPVVREEE